jgi:hypothetical protein
MYLNNTIEELTSPISNLKYYTGDNHLWLNYIFINLKKLNIIEIQIDKYIDESLKRLFDFVKVQEKLKILELPISYEKCNEEKKDLIKYCSEKNIIINWK